MYTYSIAIRTLGTAPDILKQELESIARQTVQPERVVVYIAHGYRRPDFTVGKEEYVWVKKGMVVQRALEYREITSEVILLLDDDVELAEDSAERMLMAMEEHDLDVVAADTFRNQDMSIRQKWVATLSNFVFPRRDDGWAFRQCRNGSFSYNNRPGQSVCLTETFAGPCWMAKKSALTAIRLADELWMDCMGFAYGDDAVESYKFFLNDFRVGVHYDSGVKNLDGKTSSGGYHRDNRKFYVRSFGMFTIWWRMIYESRDKKWLSALLYSLKGVWQCGLHVALALKRRDTEVLKNYARGQRDGWRFVHSEQYQQVPPYVIMQEEPNQRSHKEE